VDGGRFAVKRVTGDRVEVQADIFTDGSDEISAWLLYRREEERRWREAPMQPLVNDRWQGAFEVQALGRYRYT
jgi:starch synthase (maltosyl-transferring)